MERCTILHIEDSEADHVLFRRDLERLAFKGQYLRMPGFDDAKKYLENISASEALPDLIIADSRQGAYDGFDIVQWIKAHSRLRDIPVVVYSTAISDAQSRQMLSAGAAACLTKPIDSSESLTALDIILSYVDQRCRSKSPENTATAVAST